MFLSESLDKNMLILLLSIAFVVVIILIWFIVAKIVKSVKTDKYYKQLAKEELASLGCGEFKKEEVKPEELDSSLDNKEKKDNALEVEEASNDNEDSIAPVMIEDLEPETCMCSTDEEALDVNIEEIDEETNLVEEPVEAVEETNEASEPVVLVNSEDVSEPALIEEAPLDTEEQEEEVSEPSEDTEALEVQVEEAPVEKAPVEENDEEASLEEPKKKKGRTYNGKYEIYQTADGYAYNLKASNGEVLVTSETYTTRDGVLKAINAVKRNLENGEVRIFADKRGQYKFKLVSRNYRILAISSNYSVEKSAIRASESFKKFALKADIVDVEVVDTDIKSATPIEIGTLDDKNDGKFVVEKYNGEFSWALKASNGQILCQAEGYTSKAGCLYSIETFKRNVADGTFKTVKDKMGNFLFKLYNVSGRICAVGESYTTKQRAEDAARSVVSFYKNANVIELKETKEKDTKTKK